MSVSGKKEFDVKQILRLRWRWFSHPSPGAPGPGGCPQQEGYEHRGTAGQTRLKSHSRDRGNGLKKSSANSPSHQNILAPVPGPTPAHQRAIQTWHQQNLIEHFRANEDIPKASPEENLVKEGAEENTPDLQMITEENTDDSSESEEVQRCRRMRSISMGEEARLCRSLKMTDCTKYQEVLMKRFKKISPLCGHFATNALSRESTRSSLTVAKVESATILRVSTSSPRREGEGEGHPNDRGGTRTRKVTCRYFMNGFCKEGDNCQHSHGLPKNLEAMVRSDYHHAPEDCCRSERDGARNVKPAALKLHPPASPRLPSLEYPQVEVSPGTGKPSNASFAATGAGTDDWVYAIEFVPGKPYYGRFPHTCGEASQQGHVTEEKSGSQPREEEEPKNTAEGERPRKEGPVCLQDDSCDLCGLKFPDTEDATQRLRHNKSCIEAHEKDMELAFAVQRSRHLVCGICMEVIYEKVNPNEVRFGILSNCNHTFCLKCIRKWRRATQFENKITKACPECRVTSNFVIPSEFWVEEHEEKQKLIEQYKEAMRSKPCRYFDGGRGSCPFGLNCFYKHAQD